MQYSMHYSSNVLFMQDYTQNIFAEDTVQRKLVMFVYLH